VAESGAARFYGVVYDRDIMNASSATQDAQFALMRKAGVQTVRRVFSWDAAQPTQGQPPNFADTDALVARAARNNIEILPIVMYAPAWARQSADDPASPPRDNADYVAFLDALVARYGPNGSFWAEHTDVRSGRCARGRSGTSRSCPTSGLTRTGRRATASSCMRHTTG